MDATSPGQDVLLSPHSGQGTGSTTCDGAPKKEAPREEDFRPLRLSSPNHPMASKRLLPRNPSRTPEGTFDTSDEENSEPGKKKLKPNRHSEDVFHNHSKGAPGICNSGEDGDSRRCRGQAERLVRKTTEPVSNEKSHDVTSKISQKPERAIALNELLQGPRTESNHREQKEAVLEQVASMDDATSGQDTDGSIGGAPSKMKRLAIVAPGGPSFRSTFLDCKPITRDLKKDHVGPGKGKQLLTKNGRVKSSAKGRLMVGAAPRKRVVPEREVVSSEVIGATDRESVRVGSPMEDEGDKSPTFGRIRPRTGWVLEQPEGNGDRRSLASSKDPTVVEGSCKPRKNQFVKDEDKHQIPLLTSESDGAVETIRRQNLSGKEDREERQENTGDNWPVSQKGEGVEKEKGRPKDSNSDCLHRRLPNIPESGTLRPSCEQVQGGISGRATAIVRAMTISASDGRWHGSHAAGQVVVRTSCRYARPQTGSTGEASGGAEGRGQDGNILRREGVDESSPRDDQRVGNGDPPKVKKHIQTSFQGSRQVSKHHTAGTGSSQGAERDNQRSGNRDSHNRASFQDSGEENKRPPVSSQYSRGLERDSQKVGDRDSRKVKKLLNQASLQSNREDSRHSPANARNSQILKEDSEDEAGVSRRPRLGSTLSSPRYNRFLKRKSCKSSRSTGAIRKQGLNPEVPLRYNFSSSKIKTLSSQARDGASASSRLERITTDSSTSHSRRQLSSSVRRRGAKEERGEDQDASSNVSETDHNDSSRLDPSWSPSLISRKRQLPSKARRVGASGTREVQDVSGNVSETDHNDSSRLNPSWSPSLISRKRQLPSKTRREGASRTREEQDVSSTVNETDHNDSSRLDPSWSPSLISRKRQLPSKTRREGASGTRGEQDVSSSVSEANPGESSSWTPSPIRGRKTRKNPNCSKQRGSVQVASSSHGLIASPPRARCSSPLLASPDNLFSSGTEDGIIETGDTSARVEPMESREDTGSQERHRAGRGDDSDDSIAEVFECPRSGRVHARRLRRWDRSVEESPERWSQSPLSSPRTPTLDLTRSSESSAEGNDDSFVTADSMGEVHVGQDSDDDVAFLGGVAMASHSWMTPPIRRRGETLTLDTDDDEVVLLSDESHRTPHAIGPRSRAQSGLGRTITPGTAAAIQQLEDDEAMALRLQMEFDREETDANMRPVQPQFQPHSRPQFQPYSRVSHTFFPQGPFSNISISTSYPNASEVFFNFSPAGTSDWLPLPPSRRSPRRRGRGRSRGRPSRRILPTDPDPNDYERLLELAEQVGPAIPQGLCPTVLTRLPTFKFQADAVGSMSDEDKQCTICMSEYRAREDLRRLPCFHAYHTKCIDQWFQNSSACPICREQVRLD